jgi:site-specific DNA-cytosine methylase
MRHPVAILISIGYLFILFEVEKDPWCQRVLAARMLDGFFEKVPIISDICDFRPSPEQSQSKGLLTGFPCQAPRLFINYL